jgi:hypothetical protein
MRDDEYLPPDYDSPSGFTLSRSTGAGLAGLLIGCTLLVSACVLMTFNILLHSHFSHGLHGIPIGLSLVGAAIGLPSVTLLGVFGFVMGIRSWSAVPRGEAGALGAAATFAGFVGMAAWVIAATNLVMILLTPGLRG